MAAPPPSKKQAMADAKLDVPGDANQGCVGTQSEEAGKAAACAGCPNQSACASGAARKEDPGVARVAERLANVKHVVLVLSGKGGVGKSTVSSLLARGLAAAGKSVGLLDVDICGPSIPTMFGLVGQRVHQSATGWSPVWVTDSLGVMSIGFMLPGQDDAVIWRGPRKNGLIQQFLCDVEWGALDYLLIDTPPGTSDEHISMVQFLARAPLAGAVVVTTPQEVAMADVRKELNFCKKTSTPVLGIVENMAGFACGTCGAHTHIFRPAAGGGSGMATAFGVPLLGSLPLDPALTAACDEGGAFAPSAAIAGVLAALRAGVEGAEGMEGAGAPAAKEEETAPALPTPAVDVEALQARRAALAAALADVDAALAAAAAP